MIENEFLYGIAVFGIALLSGMGVGSAGLFVVYLTTFCGVPQKEAQILNLVFFLASCGASMAVHLTHRKIHPARTLLLTLSGLAAAFPGSYAAAFLPASLIRRLFGGMLVLSAALTLFRSMKKTKRAAENASKKRKIFQNLF